MATLSKKALRNASPIESLPFQLERKYGVPSLHATITALREALTKDVDVLVAQAERIGDRHDLDQLSLLREQVQTVMEGCKFPIVFDCLVDNYTGTRYQAVARDRRMG